MADLIKEVSDLAAGTGWNVESLPRNAVEKAGFEKGIELTSPSSDLRIEIMHSSEEVFCNFGGYGRTGSSTAADDNREMPTKLIGILQDVFRYGVDVKVFRRGAKILRSVVSTGPPEKRRVIAKTYNSIGFVREKKEGLRLGVPTRS